MPEHPPRSLPLPGGAAFVLPVLQRGRSRRGAVRFLHPGGLAGWPLVERARAPVGAVGGQCLEVVSASPGKVGGGERLPVKANRYVRAARDDGCTILRHRLDRFCVKPSSVTATPRPGRPRPSRPGGGWLHATVPDRAGRNSRGGRAPVGTVAAWRARVGRSRSCPRTTASRRIAAHATDQEPGGHGGAPEHERPGHLAPVEKTGHLQSPLPDPRGRAAVASRIGSSSLLRSGQMEQLKRSANASAATTLDRTPTQYSGDLCDLSHFGAHGAVGAQTTGSSRSVTSSFCSAVITNGARGPTHAGRAKRCEASTSCSTTATSAWSRGAYSMTAVGGRSPIRATGCGSAQPASMAACATSTGSIAWRL